MSKDVALADAERTAYVRGMYDLMGALTCDPRALTLGSGNDCAPVADRIHEVLVAKGFGDVDPYPDGEKGADSES
jgi:hypothetical protein